MDDQPHTHDRWKSRKRLANWAMAAAILETAALFWLTLPDVVVIASYGLWGTIIGSVVGTAAWDDVVARRVGQT